MSTVVFAQALQVVLDEPASTHLAVTCEEERQCPNLDDAENRNVLLPSSPGSPSLASQSRLMDLARPSKRPSISPLQTLHSAASVVDERRNINRSLKICGFSTSRSAPTFPLSPVSPSCPPLKALPLEVPELEIPPLSPPTTPLGFVDTKALSPSPLSTISSSHFDRPPARSEPRPRRQPLRSHDDEFTPAWVRGQGLDKEGYCSRCQEEQWFKLKDGSYWYHRTFVHGISSISGRPFSNPIETRCATSGDRGDAHLEGFCRTCLDWHAFETYRSNRSASRVLWYRHAHSCHKQTPIPRPAATTSPRSLQTGTSALTNAPFISLPFVNP
ncbi:hypothetical protein JCM3766R1_002714 [Sporobolomyces carnicolor]